MESFAAPARPIVARMIEQAAAAPDRAVAFQGAPGANSHIAALEAFPDCLPLPCFDFADAIDAVRDGRADCAMIPIENSLHGRVADIHFLLPESGLSITGEHFLPIQYALMGLGPLDGVKQATSHPQALGQCRHWLRAHGIEPVAYSDTAGAAALVAEKGDPAIAALAPRAAAEIYGLDILGEGIADAVDNTTRFVVLARAGHQALGDGAWMTTLIFEVKNIPAALYKAMGGFATNGVNMTKLESYQRGASFAATEFYCDVEGRPDDPGLERALAELEFQT
ncbi:MAG: prephenate dehydratase, partial [Sphingomonas bacterium]|uniref:prephenate dehydratase n=1 Tax=Sphingomonas bacterium TaxID=1895847 RepID=UPI00263A0D72